MTFINYDNNNIVDIVPNNQYRMTMHLHVGGTIIIIIIFTVVVYLRQLKYLMEFRYFCAPSKKNESVKVYNIRLQYYLGILQ